MYSVVMMLALSGASEVPQFGHHCRGCYGGCSCYGGCYGGCYGCYGCHGCHGVRYGCYGCYGCYGGGYGCYGCYGGGYSGCCGCCGGYGIMVSPMAPGTPSTPIPAPQKETRGPASSSPATITVKVPADATLFFDDHRMKSTAETRTFTTPALQPGRLYFYTVKAEMEKDGQRVAATHQVQFRAGQALNVSFDLDNAGTLTARQD